MILVYYTRVPDGKITHFEILPPEWTELQVQEKLRDFNKSHNDTCNATMVSAESGSLIEYLATMAKARQRRPKEIVDQAIEQLQDAISAIEELRGFEMNIKPAPQPCDLCECFADDSESVQKLVLCGGTK